MGGIDPDFDINEFCRNLRNSKQPPYQCPVADCLKRYRTICGLSYHLRKHDHTGNPQPTATATTPAKRTKKKGRHGNKTPGKTQELLQPVVRETLTYAEAQKVVEFEVESRVIRVGISDPIIVMAKEHYEEKYGSSDAKEGKPIPRLDPMKPDEQKIQLPEPSFTIIENYNIADAPPRPTNAYIRFIERSADELDCEVEYDLDEEDCAWLGIMNQARAEAGLPAVPVDTFELLMDRLEKESYFQMANTKPPDNVPSDDDAVCCICMDGECQNSNVILFCDMCNLAVHQDCYGVPYIPEGQWHCRRCIQSPSRAVECQLCPNTGGAFKQTDKSEWAHVVCALWIPEVRFANTVFLEPIDSLEAIPFARKKLTCYICKQKGVGACIQCHKTNCYTAFHVTCAQQAGLYMKMDTVRDNLSAAVGELAPVMVQKTAFCDAHTPAGAGANPRLPANSKTPSKVGKAAKMENNQKMKKARRIILEKNRSAVPVISIPTIPQDRVQEIASLVTLQKKNYFIQRLVAYWTLKRQFRNGVPLLRRLQTSHFARRDDGKLSTELDEIYRQMKYLKCLRQDLEKARLLCELVRKREKKKNELTRAKEACLLVKLCPLQYFLTRIWEQISSRDSNGIFSEPVDLKEVPDYSSVVTHPMDLATMKAKIDDMKYLSIAEFEVDFKLMINNCLTYNSKDTIFYRAGIKMKDLGLSVIDSARWEAQQAGIEGGGATSPAKAPPTIAAEDESSSEAPEPAPGVIEEQLATLQTTASTMSLDDQMKKLIALADLAQSVKNPISRNKKCRMIKAEMTKLKKIISKADKVSPAPKTPVKPAPETKSQNKQEPPSSAKKRPPPETEPSSSSSSSNSNSSSDDDKDSSSSEDKPLKPTNEKTPTKATAKGRRSTATTVDVKKTPKDEVVKKTSEAEVRTESRTPSKTSTGSDSTTASPSGVNRRTAVLFTRKAVAFKKPTATSTNSTAASPSPPVAPPAKRRVGRPRRNLDASLTEAAKEKEDATVAEKPPVPTSDSFRIYRSGGEIPQESDDDDTQSESSCSGSCSGSSGSCSGSSDGSSSGDSSSDEDAVAKGDAETPLEPLTVVWAKCRGYPWYPALIINPKMPRDYIHNGVPIPAPPADVLALANSYTEPVYLVLFFDAKRTWQWLPRNKLELLGISDELDEAKRTESRKPADRKAVKKAYQDALHHLCQVKSKKV